MPRRTVRPPGPPARAWARATDRHGDAALPGPGPGRGGPVIISGLPRPLPQAPTQASTCSPSPAASGGESDSDALTGSLVSLTQHWQVGTNRDLTVSSSLRQAHPGFPTASQLEHFPSGPRLCRRPAGSHPPSGTLVPMISYMI
jgi:hypothetical protein